MRPLPTGLTASLVVSVLLPAALSQLAPGWSRPGPVPALRPAPLDPVSVPRGLGFSEGSWVTARTAAAAYVHRTPLPHPREPAHVRS